MSDIDELQHLQVEGGSYARIKYLRSKIKRATITELRKLLREHGVKFHEFTFMTQWKGALGESIEAYPIDMFPDKLLVKHVYLTPAQAAAATLGSETCHMEYCLELSNDELYPTEAYECSVCGSVTVEGKPNFCPNCGAKVVDG